MAFVLGAEDVYAVLTGFPRITAAELPGGTAPAGIGAVSYEVDLEAADAFRLGDGGFDAAAALLLP